MKRSCGPKCLLFISNYVFIRQPPQFFFSIKSVKQKQVKITIMISDIKSWMYRLGFLQIHIISISGHYIVKIWQTVAGTGGRHLVDIIGDISWTKGVTSHGHFWRHFVDKNVHEMSSFWVTFCGHFLGDISWTFLDEFLRTIIKQ